MNKIQLKQYTLRGVPARVGARLRELACGLGVGDVEMRYTDLDDLAGAWVPDPEFDRVLAEMDRIDPELWK